ncbi:MAG TPA: peptide ABC transporter substrate-binding protein [Ktedonobacteraceae bacterium]|nr:peptide ABC transporter substrate-binding protein [Ktedonobacteraceae bacterium]
MRVRSRQFKRPQMLAYWLVSMVILLLAACGTSGGVVVAPTGTSSATKPPVRQILTLPDVGSADSLPLDPAVTTDANTQMIMNMIYSGLVRDDKDFNVLPDQATWDVSANNKVYTFHLMPNIDFSDGTPVTAQSYVYTLTRALLPQTQSPDAALYMGMIAGADTVMAGKTRTLAGVRSLNSQTLQITLVQPTPYFLQLLTNPIYFPLNEQVINAYPQGNWASEVAGNGVGSGPFMVRSWVHSFKMTLVPNPYYYGSKPRLTAITIVFASDASAAFQTYRAGGYSLMWNIAPADQASAKNFPGFVRVPQLETDAFFFNTTMPPFNNLIVRQAFAYATDKQTLANTIMSGTVAPAATILAPGIPGYQANNSGIPYDKNKAQSLLQSVYPDLTTVPPITFSYPSPALSQSEAVFLEHMWRDALGIPIMMRAVEPTAYNDELAKNQVQFGFIQWNADYADPYDVLGQYLLSNSPNNVGQWSNSSFDQLVQAAEKTSGSARLALYQDAESLAIQDVAWLPLDHQEMAAIIPAALHGVSVNGNGLYFGDWSQVYLT